MNFDTEQQLRNEARFLHAGGVLTWSNRLRAAGLDPYRWRDGTPTGIEPPPSREQRGGVGAMMHRAAPLQPRTFDEKDNSLEVIWSTGAGVLRHTWDGTVNEILDLSGARLGRLNAGAPFCNSHEVGTLGSVLGAVVPGSARVVGDKGTCRIALSSAPENAGLVADIRAGIIRNTSIGYRIFASRIADVRGQDVPNMIVSDFEPYEISAVAVPADPGAQIRGRHSSEGPSPARASCGS